MKNLSTDIAVIKNTLENLEGKFDNMNTKLDKFSEKVIDVEVRQGSLDSKITAITVFQSIFSIVIGAIASYLGVTKKS